MRFFSPTPFIGMLLAVGTIPGSLQAVDFEKEILPLFKASCIECHRAPYEENGRTKKPKAGLRMDAAWALSAGSENGSVLKPGDPDKSELFYRVTLPHDDDDFMPPSGKADPLTTEQVALFKKWIEAGADFGDWEGNLEGKPAEVTTGGKAPVSEIQEVYKRLSASVDMPEDKSWEPVTAAGGRVQRLALKSPLLEVDFRLSGDEANDDSVAAAAVIAANVAHLDLSKTAITDNSVSIVKEMPNLVRLNLSKTSVTDKALSHLNDLEELRVLNLYGTQVTDKGLNQLKGLKNLEAVYLWQSKATPKGAKALEAAIPGVKVNLK